MTITVDIRPEVQEELARQAASHGSEIEEYAASLLEAAVHVPAGSSLGSAKPERLSGKNLVEVCAMVRGLANDVDFSRNRSTGRPIDLSE